LHKLEKTFDLNLLFML